MSESNENNKHFFTVNLVKLQYTVYFNKDQSQPVSFLCEIGCYLLL